MTGTAESIYSDGTYQEHNQSWHVEDSPWKAQQILRILQKNDINPATVAEVGCGAGEILRQLSVELPDATFAGYEMSPQAIALSKSRESEPGELSAPRPDADRRVLRLPAVHRRFRAHRGLHGFHQEARTQSKARCLSHSSGSDRSWSTSRDHVAVACPFWTHPLLQQGNRTCHVERLRLPCDRQLLHNTVPGLPRRKPEAANVQACLSGSVQGETGLGRRAVLASAP